jgi:Asp-tRNA(Asn)/Glu-tRNA(Gln) amidotransferase A subunit family amidase
MGRSVGDVRTLFEVMKGPDTDDVLSSPVEGKKYRERDLAGTRIGILETEALGTPTPETKAAVHRAAGLLAEHQFKVEPLRMEGLEQAIELWWFFFGPMVAHLYAGMVAGHESELSPMFREYMSVANLKVAPTLDKFMDACVQRDTVRAALMRQMRDVPILLSPVCLAPAFRYSEGNWQPGTGYRETMRHSQWLNLAGSPGVSLPMGHSAEGLPIGVQIIGRPYEEEMVLAVAGALEGARGKWEAPPGV